MEYIEVTGQIPLKGSVSIQGSKNAVLPMMAAALLQEETCILHNCPKIADVYTMVEILQELGAKVFWEGHTLSIQCDTLQDFRISERLAKRMRSSIILMGVLLVRMKRAEIPYPGGCVIGRRPIDMHIRLLQRLGAYIEEKDGALVARASQLEGDTIEFSKKSVGATEHTILSAVLAKGTTILKNYAKEPEITALCEMLRKMGADIRETLEDTMVICGVKELKGVEFEIPPDRIVAGTYILAGAITRGRIQIENARIGEMQSLLRIYKKMGGQYQEFGGKLLLESAEIAKPISYIETGAYPEFPTDLQSLLMVLCLTVEGKSCIKETIFEDRYKIVPQLIRMGARIQIDGRIALIDGGTVMTANDVYAMELRGGAALVLAGLCACGKTRVWNTHFIERGYESIVEDLKNLGAEIAKQQESKG